ncbi:MAG: rod shape-determining protein MreD [Cyanobacteria bacterium P01_H01_bin.15]
MKRVAVPWRRLLSIPIPRNVWPLCNSAVVVGSVLLCAVFMLARFPGTELLNVGPNWLLIWVVVWSLKRQPAQALLAGLLVGMIHDALVSTPYPFRTILLAFAGLMTARLRFDRWLQAEWATLLLVSFFMAAALEIINAGQHFWSLQTTFLPVDWAKAGSIFWQELPRIALTSAVLTSLWAPVVYYPLKRWGSFYENRQSRRLRSR